jgi:hypothetical protein
VRLTGELCIVLQIQTFTGTRTSLTGLILPFKFSRFSTDHPKSGLSNWWRNCFSYPLGLRNVKLTSASFSTKMDNLTFDHD